MSFVLPPRQGSAIPSYGTAYTVNLDGQTITFSSTSNRWAGVRVNADGTVDRRGGGTGVYNQIDSGTDWIIPNAEANNYAFEVKADVNSTSGNGLDAGSAATGSWLALTSDREWFCNRTTVGTDSANLTISIRLGGDVLDTGIYFLEATKTSTPPTGVGVVGVGGVLILSA